MRARGPSFEIFAPNTVQSAAVTTDLAKFCVESRRSAAVVRVTGEVDFSNAPVLTAVLQDVIGSGSSAGEVVVDLAGLTFIDARGLGALAEGRRLADSAGKRFVLANPPAIVRRLIGITGLTDVLVVLDEPQRRRSQ